MTVPVKTPDLIQRPIHQGWLIPKGWEQILGFEMDHRLGGSVLHLWRVQWNQHLGQDDSVQSHVHAHHQILYYQKDEGRWLASGEPHAVSKGSIFLFLPAATIVF